MSRLRAVQFGCRRPIHVRRTTHGGTASPATTHTTSSRFGALVGPRPPGDDGRRGHLRRAGHDLRMMLARARRRSPQRPQSRAYQQNFEPKLARHGLGPATVVPNGNFFMRVPVRIHGSAPIEEQVIEARRQRHAPGGDGHRCRHLELPGGPQPRDRSRRADASPRDPIPCLTAFTRHQSARWLARASSEHRRKRLHSNPGKLVRNPPQIRAPGTVRPTQPLWRPRNRTPEEAALRDVENAADCRRPFAAFPAGDDVSKAPRRICPKMPPGLLSGLEVDR